jgi:hypothetical protein
MEEREDKGFVVKDRRKISLEDSDAEAIGQEPEQTGQSVDYGTPSGAGSQPGKDLGGSQPPLPQVTFATFVFSMCSSALVHLGEVPEPETQRTVVDLDVAKQIIDTLGMLEEKTKGNLDPDEERLLKSMLYDLRVRYVQKSNS